MDAADFRALEARDDKEPSDGRARLLTLAVTAAVAGADRVGGSVLQAGRA